MSPGRAYQLLHSDAFSAELEALGLDSGIFGGADLPAPIMQILVPRHADILDESANTFGTVNEPHTYTRASVGMYRDAAGVWQTAASNTLRLHHSLSGAFLGALFEPSSTNLFLNSDAPVSQSISLSTGNHTISVHGTGTVTSADGTGTATGHGAASEGTDVTIDVTVGGTIDFAVAGSPDLAQVEALAFSTTPIITAGSTVSRLADSGLLWSVVPAGYSNTEGTLIFDWTPLYNGEHQSGNKSMVVLNNAFVSHSYIGESANVLRLKAYDGTGGPSLSIGTTVKGITHRFVVTWESITPRVHAGARPSSTGLWSWHDANYAGAWLNGGPVVRFVAFPSLSLPQCMKNCRLYNRHFSQAETERLFTT